MFYALATPHIVYPAVKNIACTNHATYYDPGPTWFSHNSAEKEAVMDFDESGGSSNPPGENYRGTFPCKARGMGPQAVADYAQCIAVTVIPARNGSVCRGCSSRWRHCNACVNEGIVREQHAWADDPETGLCVWHKEHGARVSKRKDPAFRPTKPSRDGGRDTSPRVDVSARSATTVGASAKPVTHVEGNAAAELHVEEAQGNDDEESPDWREKLARIQKAVADSILIKVEPQCIRPMPGQPRRYFNPTALSGLGVSIRKAGQMMPGMIRPVRDGVDGVEYELLDGERRWREVGNIPGMLYRATVVDVTDDDAPYIIATIANFNREGHTPMEVSDAIHALRKMGAPMQAIADMCSFTLAWAYQMHGLQSLHADLRHLLDERVVGRENYLPLTAAIQISKLHPDLQVETAQRVIRREVSLAGLRGEVVRVSAEHGSSVRMYTTSPSKRWDKLARRAEGIQKSALGMLDILGESGMGGVLQDRSRSEIEQTIADLEAGKAKIDEVIAAIRVKAGIRR